MSAQNMPLPQLRDLALRRMREGIGDREGWSVAMRVGAVVNSHTMWTRIEMPDGELQENAHRIEQYVDGKVEDALRSLGVP